MAPPPSDPRRPRISAQAKDKDVVQEAGRLLCVKPLIENRQNPNWSPVWRVIQRGRRAAALMMALEPLLGVRRSEQIHAAIASTTQPRETTYP